MSKHAKRRVVKAVPREPFPWGPFLLLLAIIGLFWGVPRLMPKEPVKVDFSAAR